jgi:hypothetical protein
MSYDNPWIYDGKIFESEDIKDSYGFVYLIECLLTGKKYLGRKYFWQFRTPKGKKRRAKSESDWKNYYGSSKSLKDDINLMVNKIIKGPYFHYIRLQEKQTMRKLINYL